MFAYIFQEISLNTTDLYSAVSRYPRSLSAFYNFDSKSKVALLLLFTFVFAFFFAGMNKSHSQYIIIFHLIIVA